MRNSSAPIDALDREILAVLRADARTPVSEIARVVGLTAAPVARRIERLEQRGVIRGYRVIIDESRGGSLEAFTEVHLSGGLATQDFGSVVRGIPEVTELLTIAGDVDALVHFRVDDVDHLQRVVNALRRTGQVTGTRTHIVLHRWSRADEDQDRDSEP